MLNSNVKNLKIFKTGLALMLASTLAFAEAPQEEHYLMQNDYVQTTTKVNMRTDNSIYGDLIYEIESNQALQRILSCSDNWDLVIYKNKIGFVCRDYVIDVSEKIDDLEIEHQDGYIKANTGVNLRLGPSTNDKIISSLSTDDLADVLGKTTDGWYLVLYKGKIGYVSGEYVQYQESIPLKSEDGKLYIYSASNVNFRTEPKKDSDKITLIKKGNKLEVISQEENGWYKVLYNGQIGYVSNEFTTFNPPGSYRNDVLRVVYAKGEIELKNSPNQDAGTIYTMNKYETCEVLAATKDKYFVRCAGKIGYISKDKTSPLYNTFVVIDINDQKLVLYQDDQILLETNIVTGQKDQYDTPEGLYSIRNKKTDTFLVGEDYFTHVDYWMPFNGGIGLHDATWRRKFGGNIYEKDGSHGCVNIPAEYADDIFYTVEKGTKVLVHK